MRLRTLLVGGAIGAALGYFFDPVSGRGRRMRLREQAIAKARDARAQAERRKQQHATGGEGAGMGLVDLAEATVNDGTLEQRIRSTVLGSPDVRSESVTIEVVDGHVTLRGEVGSTEHADEIARRVETVPGVTAVDVLVHLPGEVAPNKEASIRASEDAATGRTQNRTEQR